MLRKRVVLRIEKGPRKGESVESKEGESCIRIGRVLRGNNLTIKDPSISQRHLIIQSIDGIDWSVTDLDTSNGTLLNDSPLQPNQPSLLHHLDSIKIGSTTSISVHLLPLSPPPPPPPPDTRHCIPNFQETTTTTPTTTTTTNPTSQDSDLNQIVHPKPDPPRRPTTRRGAKAKAKAKAEAEAAAPGVDQNCNYIVDLDLEKIDGPKPDPVRRRGGRVTRRRPAASADEQNCGRLNGCKSGEEVEESGLGSNPAPRVTTRREAKAEAEAEAKAKAKAEVEDAYVEKSMSVGLNCDRENVDLLSVDGRGDGKLIHEGEAGIGGEKEVFKEEGKKEEELESMTLGEWFDRMEKYLPRKIDEAAEEIIASLRQRQQRFEEFVREHYRNEKGQFPLPDSN